MIIIKEQGKKFINYVDQLKNTFGDLTSLIDETNIEIFRLRRNQTKEFKQINLNKIQIGRFYLISYNFNGNILYCPILSIDYRVSGNKHILYAINLDYLPFQYKRLYFNKMYNTFEQIFNGNEDSDDVLLEDSLPLNFENVYNSLKDNGKFHYAISAFDITKIKECYLISTNLMYLTINMHMRKLNVALMKETMKNYEMINIKKVN